MKKGSILLADDNFALRTLISKYLEYWGYLVLQAENGVEVLNLLKKEAGIQLLLTDIIMPNGLMGTELLEKARDYNANLKFIFMSGHSKVFLLQEGYIKNENFPVLTKPFSKVDLEVLVQKTLEAEVVQF